LGKTVFEGFLRVNPKGIAKVVVTYTLPDSISVQDYQLLVQRQPGADTTTLNMEIDGKKIYDAPLNLDKVFNTKR
jgi:hypothetical protein